MYVFTVSLGAWGLWRSEEGTEYPRTRVKDSGKLPHECWDSNLFSARTTSAVNPSTISTAHGWLSLYMLHIVSGHPWQDKIPNRLVRLAFSYIWMERGYQHDRENWICKYIYVCTSVSPLPLGLSNSRDNRISKLTQVDDPLSKVTGTKGTSDLEFFGC